MRVVCENTAPKGRRITNGNQMLRKQKPTLRNDMSINLTQLVSRLSDVHNIRLIFFFASQEGKSLIWGCISLWHRFLPSLFGFTGQVRRSLQITQYMSTWKLTLTDWPFTWQGFARFTNTRYSTDKSTMSNSYMHLTNYSIQVTVLLLT